MFNISNDNNNNLPLPVQDKNLYPHQTFLQKAQECIQNSDCKKAVQHLLNALNSSIENEPLYELLFTLIPKADEREYSNIITNLSKLLERTFDLPKMQMQLALTLAEWNVASSENKNEDEKLQKYSDAIDYYASAIKMAIREGNRHLTLEIHRTVSRLLIRAFKIDIEKRLFLNVGKIDQYFELVQSIGLFEKFCCCKEDKALVQGIYDQAGSIIAGLPFERKSHYRNCLEVIEEGTHYFKLSDMPLSEIYRNRLQDLRAKYETILSNKSISSESVKKFQREIFEAMSSFIGRMFEDLFTALGEPPCGYDLRAMGSMGRKEICPFSDFEFYVLIEKEEHRPYFQLLLRLLNLQIISLGETNFPTHPVFTSLQKTLASGFYFDPGNPLQDGRLLGTPSAVAQMQEIAPSSAAPNTAENSLLKSVSLSTNCPHLFSDYRGEMNKILNEGTIRKDRFLVLCNRRYKEFHGFKFIAALWHTSAFPDIVHLKDHYVQFLHFFLADMALYWSIDETNTADIIDRLVEKDAFTSLSGFLMKNAICRIYQIRVRLHLFYQEQKELGYQKGVSGCRLTGEEINDLEQIYWLILRPFYHNCLASILEKDESIEKVFYKTDLITLCLDEIIASPSDPSFFLPLIPHLAHEPLVNHVQTFKRLSTRSNLEILREEYFNILEKNQTPQIILEELEMVPNRSGLRLSFLRKERELRANIRAITISDFHMDKTVPQVKITSSQGIRFLKPEVAKRIIDDHGDLKKDYYGSNHRVTSAEGLHFKQKPIHPLMEFAIHALFYRIAGYLTPSTELVRFQVDGEKIYPVLISTTIEGKTFKEDHQFEKVQWSKWTWLLLCSILVRPGDGLPSNYVITKDNIPYSIDNDIHFADPIVQNGRNSTINFCSALFCHFQDKPLDRDVLQEFCALDSDAILEGWIEEVIQKEKEYQNLFSKEERAIFYQEDPENRFKVKALFRMGALSTLNLQFVYLQNQLSESLRNAREITPLDLLKQIVYVADNFTISAAAGRKISQLYLEAKKYPLDQQLGWITQRSHGKSLSSLKSDEACLGYIPTFEEVEIRGSLSPVKAKEELAASLLHRSVSFFSIGNIEGKKTLKANFKEMKLENNEPDIERQEHVLKALVCLAEISAEKIITLAIQHCAVMSIKYLKSFFHPGIEYLDLRYCPQIDDKDMLEISKLPRLKELHLSGCRGLGTVVERGFFSNGPLTFSCLRHLNIEECPNLKEIRLRSPLLKEVQIRKNDQLKVAEIGSSFLFVKVSKDDHRNINYGVNYIMLSDWSKLLNSHEYLNDTGLVLDAIKKEGFAVAHSYITNEMKNNREFILAAMEGGEEVQKFLGIASKEILNEKEFILLAVQRKGSSLKFASNGCREDREIVLAAVKQWGLALQYASEGCKNERDIVLAAVQSTGEALEYACDELKNDEEIIFAAIRQNGSAFEYAGEEIKNNKFFKLLAIRRYGEALEIVYGKMKNDKRFVLDAVQQKGLALQYASEECKGDKEIVLVAVKQDGLALEYANDECKNLREIVIEAVKQNGLALEYASERLKDQEQVVIQAIKKAPIIQFFSKPSAFKFASERLKISKKFVLEAMKKNRNVLNFAHEEIRREIRREEYQITFASEESKNNKEKILAAVKEDGFALQFASDNLKDSKEIVLEAVCTYPRALEYASKMLKDSRGFMTELISKRIPVCEYASERLRNDHDFLLAAVRIDGEALHFASERLKNNREIVLAAVNTSGKVLRYLNDDCKNNQEIVLTAINNDPSAFKDASVELKNDKKFILEVAKRQGCVLKYLLEEHKNEANIVLAAVQQDGNALQYASDKLKANKQIVKEAIKKNGEALQFADKKLADDEEIVICTVKRPFIFNSKSLFSGFRFASNRLKTDRNFVLRAMNINIAVLDHTEELMNDKDFVLKAVQLKVEVFKYASFECRNDPEIALIAILMEVETFTYASDQLKNDQEFVLMAILKNPKAFKYASDQLKDNKEFILKAVGREGRVLQFVSDQFKQDTAIVLKAIQQNGECLVYASDGCKNNRDFVLIAVRNGLALDCAAKKFSCDKEIVLEAVKQRKSALTLADKSIVDDPIFDPYRN